MDMSDPDIQFNTFGVCNHCLRYDDQKNKRLNVGEDSEEVFYTLIDNIKKSGKKKKYDCVIGISGGVDSTYVAYLLVKNGIKPLAVHFDNGWNSELAVSNIEKIIDTLDIDLYSHVIDWTVFKDIQIAFLKSSTPDGEIPTDHAINAVLMDIASKYSLKYIINGMNFSTEGMAVPAWAYGHSDWTYIKTVLKKFGISKKQIKKYPHFSLLKLFYNLFIRRVKIVSILNYIDYNKNTVLKTIIDKLGYRPYEQKHYESVYTRFFQGFYLIKKFKIDKRRGHMSDLIRSGQLSRTKALDNIKKTPYQNSVLMKNDIAFVIKKLGLSKERLNEIINSKNKCFKDYINSEKRITKYKKIYNSLRLKGIMSK